MTGQSLQSRLTDTGIERVVSSTREERRDIVVRRAGPDVLVGFDIDARTALSAFGRMHERVAGTPLPGAGLHTLSPDEARHVAHLLLAAADAPPTDDAALTEAGEETRGEPQ